MGKRPAICLSCCWTKPYFKYRYNYVIYFAIQIVSDQKIRIYDIEFSFVVHRVFDEDEQILSQALETSKITANKNLNKHVSKQFFHMRCRVHHGMPSEQIRCYLCRADRLKTGMRDAFGKAQWKVSIVKICLILYSVRIHEQNIKKALAAFYRGKNKFLGSQKIVVSNKQGFTGLTRLEYKKLSQKSKLKNNRFNIKVAKVKGPLSQAPEFIVNKPKVSKIIMMLFKQNQLGTQQDIIQKYQQS